MNGKLCVLILLLVIALLPACATMEGLGKDVQKVGEKIEDAADR
jgi:predicted small secreted protein